MNEVSFSHEDYLEAIVALGGTSEHSVRPVDIATKLDVSKASVSKAIASLKKESYVEQAYYGSVTLTPTGYKYGLAILERHRLLATFLNKKLGIPKDQAEKEACLMEHAISDESFKKWVAFIKSFDL